MERVVETQQRIIYFLLCILVALGLTWLIGDAEFTKPQLYVLFLLFFSIGLWITEAIPPFAVGIMIVGFLVFTFGNPDINPRNADVGKYVNTWSNSVIWLLLGGFFLAEGMKKTGLDKDVFRISVLRYSNKPKSILLRIMLATAVVSMVMSNTATTAMMIASMMPLLNKLDKDSPFARSLLIGIPAAATVGGMGTIIGSSPNAIAVDTINRIPGIPFEIGFLEWMAFGVPVSLVLVLVLWAVLSRRYVPRVHQLDLASLEAAPSDIPTDADSEYDRRMQKRIVLAVMVLTILLWLTEKLHHIPAPAVSGIPIIILTMVSIVTGDDVRQLPWDTLMLVAGGLSLGLAIEQTGLAAYFVAELGNIQMSFWLLTAVFAITTIILSNVMSNTATATILIPMAVLWNGPNPLILPLVIGLCASCALFLPVSTPPNAIAFSTGRISQSDFRLSGSVAGLLGPALIILWTAFMTLVIL